MLDLIFYFPLLRFTPIPEIDGSAYMKLIILHFLILIWFDYVISMNILVKSWEAQGAWYGGKNNEL